MSPQITRSTGIPITIGGMTYGYAGGGYKGATQELDDAVVRESEFMAKEFKKPVEIRFNSDKQSGGAWIKNQSGSSQVGLSAGLYPTFPRGMDGILTLRREGYNWLPFNDRSMRSMSFQSMSFTIPWSIETL